MKKNRSKKMKKIFVFSISVLLSTSVFFTVDRVSRKIYRNTTSGNDLHFVSYTVEDTVRYQIGGKLYYSRTGFNPFDSITVIKTYYSPIPEENRIYNLTNLTHYREYHFIVHNHHSSAHHKFEGSHFDKEYEKEIYRTHYEQVFRARLEATPSEYIDPAIKDFNGHWVYLKEHNGNYYLNDRWDFISSFCIADSVFIYHYMDGPDPRKIVEAISLPENGISIHFIGGHMEIEVIDKEKSVYRFTDRFNKVRSIAPTQAINNFEIIQYANNTGEVVVGED